MSFESLSNQHHFTSTNRPKRKNKSKHKKDTESPAHPIIPHEEYKELACLSPNDLIQKKQSPNKKVRLAADTKDFRIKWKTEICHYWEIHGECKYGDNCAFAHGSKDIRNRKLSMNYKTKQCKQFFDQGYCPYGARCQFSHKSMETHQHQYVSYSEILSEFLSLDRADEKILKCPRLETFETFGCSNEKVKEENRLQLFEDFIEAKKYFYHEESSTINHENEEGIIIRGRPLSI